MYYGKSINIFAENELRDFLQDKNRNIKSQIEGESDNYTLNVNETEYVNHLVDKFSVVNINLRFEEISVSSEEKKIRAERFPDRFLFDVRSGESYTKVVIKYHIPYEGDKALLRCTPNSRLVWTTEVSLEDNCVCFEVINFYDDADRIKREADDIIDGIQKQSENVKREVAAYNSSLEHEIRSLFEARKQYLLKKNDLVTSLGVPIRKKTDLPPTFAIPTPKIRQKIRVTKPSVLEKGYKPEPTLEQTTYDEILQILHDWGKQLERMPSTYTDKNEEDLRDLFLTFLEPYFEGTATGETFNKSGKTDILLRHEGSNVFIAECKFWRGKKAYLETITQLLGYLTWRDSKAAVMIFVKNKDFSSVIETVEKATPEHPNYLGFVDKKDESWLNYRKHVNDDPNREVKLAVLLFHFP